MAKFCPTCGKTKDVENWGEWHLDHIKLLWAVENLRKGHRA